MIQDQQINEIWVLAEKDQGLLNSVSFEMIARGVKLKEKLKSSKVVSVLLSDQKVPQEIDDLIAYGADEVLCVIDHRLKNFLVEDQANILADLLEKKKPYIFLAAATTYGRTLMPYLAGKIYCGLTADCSILDIDNETQELLQTRPAIGGNILATIKTPETRPQMATIRPHSTKILTPDPHRKAKINEYIPPDECFVSKIKFIKFQDSSEEEIPVTDAQKIIAGGRGMGKKENFVHIERLAEILNAAVGASREVIDRGWLSYPHQIGLSGKTVNPALYICAGVSGAIQHLAGMQTSKHIIAINKDPHAHIFNVANLSIIGNLNEILPLLCEKLLEKKESGDEL